MRFNFSKTIFAIFGENFRNGELKFRGHRFIRIETGKASPASQTTPDRRFTSAHHANEHDGFSALVHACNMRPNRACEKGIAILTGAIVIPSGGIPIGRNADFTIEADVNMLKWCDQLGF